MSEELNEVLDDPTPSRTVARLHCADCGEVIGTITGSPEGVKREAEHHKASSVKCSACQNPEGTDVR